jgi:hypothetical protein
MMLHVSKSIQMVLPERHPNKAEWYDACGDSTDARTTFMMHDDMERCDP